MSFSSDTFPADNDGQDPSAELRPRKRDQTETDLMALVCAGSTGDVIAQSELVRRYRRRLAGFLIPFVIRRTDVEELVQVAFIKMSRQLHLLREPAQFETWLFTLARNTAIDFIRRQRRERTVLVEETSYESPQPESTRRVAEIMEVFELALSHLSPVDQDLLRMRIRGDSYQFIAARMGLTVVTIKGRLCRTRPRLKTLMDTAASARSEASGCAVAPPAQMVRFQEKVAPTENSPSAAQWAQKAEDVRLARGLTQQSGTKSDREPHAPRVPTCNGATNGDCSHLTPAASPRASCHVTR